jgi:hypothetical protein
LSEILCRKAQEEFSLDTTTIEDEATTLLWKGQNRLLSDAASYLRRTEPRRNLPRTEKGNASIFFWGRERGEMKRKYVQH